MDDLHQALAEKYPNLRYMPGTDPGSQYIVFARKGNICLGIKPNAIAKGSRVGGPSGTTYFGARLRTAKHNLWDDTTDPIKHDTQTYLDLKDAWPAVTWDNKHAIRCSTQMGTFFKGDIESAPEILMQQLESQDAVGKLTDYLITLAPEETLTLTPEELKDVLATIFAPALQEIHSMLAKAMEVKEQIPDPVAKASGQFGMLGVLAKNLNKQIGEYKSELKSPLPIGVKEVSNDAEDLPDFAGDEEDEEEDEDDDNDD